MLHVQESKLAREFREEAEETRLHGLVSYREGLHVEVCCVKPRRIKKAEWRWQLNSKLSCRSSGHLFKQLLGSRVGMGLKNCSACLHAKMNMYPVFRSARPASELLNISHALKKMSSRITRRELLHSFHMETETSRERRGGVPYNPLTDSREDAEGFKGFRRVL